MFRLLIRRMNLTLQKLKDLRASLPFKKSVVGFAVHPAVEAELRKDYLCDTTVSHTHFSQIPIIIDNRLTKLGVEAYYDHDLWMKRVEEQEKYEKNNLS
jgi:hypothetical protein